jgi:hypothetical protein
MAVGYQQAGGEADRGPDAAGRLTSGGRHGTKGRGQVPRPFSFRSLVVTVTGEI